MRLRFWNPLDRYVFSEFWRIFLAMALGFPVLVIIIDITENLSSYLDRRLPPARIALSYLYWLPDSMFMVLPAAVLFATVFTIGSLTRHSEITAAKASGISFYRFIAPVFAGALFATVLGLVLGDIAPHTNQRRQELLETRRFATTTDRFNFAYAAEGGRVYQIGSLRPQAGTISALQIERRGRGPEYPTYVLTSQGATFRGNGPEPSWLLGRGAMHLIDATPAGSDVTFTFDSLVDNRFRERPIELTASPRAPAEMEFRELGRFIRAMERSGADVGELKVERMLKIAIPVTSIVILLFGAPLATSTQRGGTAYGVAISLGTTVVFLMLVQMTKAVGGKGLIPPELAAWTPSLLFGTIGAVFFARVRT